MIKCGCDRDHRISGQFAVYIGSLVGHFAFRIRKMESFQFHVGRDNISVLVNAYNRYNHWRLVDRT